MSKYHYIQAFTVFHIYPWPRIISVYLLLHLSCSPPSEAGGMIPPLLLLLLLLSYSIVPLWLVCLPLLTQPSRNVAVIDRWRSVSAQGLHACMALCTCYYVIIRTRTASEMIRKYVTDMEACLILSSCFLLCFFSEHSGVFPECKSFCELKISTLKTRCLVSF